MGYTLNPPKQEDIQKKYEFTYDELHLLLRVFSTTVAVTMQNMKGGTTLHTNTITEPIVNQYIKEINEGYYKL